MPRYYGDLARGLGSDCLVLMSQWRGQRPEPLGDERLTVLPWATRESHRHWNVRRARQFVDAAVEDHRPDVLLMGNFRPYGRVGVRLARRHSIPVAVFSHGTEILQTSKRWSEHALKRRWWNTVVNDVDLHVTNSHFTSECAQGLGFPADRIEIVHPEVDNVLFRPARDDAEKRELRMRFGIPEDELVSLFVGRLQDRKGVPELLEAFARLTTPSRLVLCSEVDPEPWQARARDLGIAERSQFVTAEWDELPSLYRTADIFVHPSRHHGARNEAEGFGIVYLEAAASGVPSLATRTGGIPEAVEDGVSGVLVPPQDVDALADAWERLLSDNDERRRLGTGGLCGRSCKHGRGTSAVQLREVFEKRFG